MKTRELILNLLSKSKNPCTAKGISFELGKSSADIRKILSNLFREGKIKKVAYGLYESVNLEAEGVNLKNDELIRSARNEYFRKRYAENREIINACQRKYYADHRAEFRAYQKKYYQENIEKYRAFNRKYYALYPERYKEYQRRYWLKKAGMQNQERL